MQMKEVIRSKRKECGYTQEQVTFFRENKNWPSSLERGMLLVRRARRWGLEKPICKTESHDDSKTIS